MLEGTGRFYELRFNSRFYEGQGRRVSATAWQYAGVQPCESGVQRCESGVQRCESGGPEPGRVHRAVVCVVPRLLLHSATAFLCCRVPFAVFYLPRCRLDSEVSSGVRHGACISFDRGWGQMGGVWGRWTVPRCDVVVTLDP